MSRGLTTPKKRVADAIEALGDGCTALTRVCARLRKKGHLVEAAGALGSELNRISCALVNVVSFAPRMEIEDIPAATVALAKFSQYRSESSTIDRAVRRQVNDTLALLHQLASLPPRKVPKKSAKKARKTRKKKP